jgi:hypothetical protein
MVELHNGSFKNFYRPIGVPPFSLDFNYLFFPLCLGSFLISITLLSISVLEFDAIGVVSPEELPSASFCLRPSPHSCVLRAAVRRNGEEGVSKGRWTEEDYGGGWGGQCDRRARAGHGMTIYIGA